MPRTLAAGAFVLRKAAVQRYGGLLRTLAPTAGPTTPSHGVRALLTPGEFVVHPETVARFGAGFFSTLNALAFPARALAQRVRGFASGGGVPSLGAFRGPA